MESKLHGTLRKPLKKTFGVDVTALIERENNCYRVALEKESIDVDKSVFLYGVPQEGDVARRERFKNLIEKKEE